MEIVKQSIILIACLVALMALSHLLSRALSRVVRRDWLFYLLLAPGTLVHELSHAVASLVLLVPVREAHLFRLRHQPDGTVQLGEVVHDDADPVRNFLIAVAPLLCASLLIYGLSVWLLPENESWEMLLRSGWTYLFLASVFLVALGLSPSRQDLKALRAFLAVALALGLVGFVVVLVLSRVWDLSATGKGIEAALKTVNTGLLFVLVVVAVIYAVFFLVERVVLRG
jgi:hypothetical protein